MEQKQWLIDHQNLWDIFFALDHAINSQRTDSLQQKKLKELQDIFQAALDNTAWEYDEETGERLQPTERVMISLVPQSGDWWSDPYAVVPVAGQTANMGKQRWAVIEKKGGRPVGEKTYSQKTHAYRACRRLNDAARLAFEDKRGWFPTPALAAEEETGLMQ